MAHPRSKKSNHPVKKHRCDILPQKGILFEEVEDGIRRVGKIISLKDFMRVPEGIGGRVGVIPWFIATVIGADGERRENAMVQLCVSNHLYLSDMGGGFKKITSPYEGLIKELEEEVPAWKDEILTKIHHPSTFILALEQCAIHPGVKDPIPIQFLIFPQVSAEQLERVPFQPTEEVRAVMVRTLEQFHEIVDHRPTIASSGIRMYHLFRRHEIVGRALLGFFHAGLQKIEYREEDLVDENVKVVLNDGVSTATFDELVRNNSNFSRNPKENVWLMRKAYAKRQLGHTMENSPIPKRNRTMYRNHRRQPIRNQKKQMNTKRNKRRNVSS